MDLLIIESIVLLVVYITVFSVQDSGVLPSYCWLFTILYSVVKIVACCYGWKQVAKNCYWLFALLYTLFKIVTCCFSMLWMETLQKGELV